MLQTSCGSRWNKRGELTQPSVFVFNRPVTSLGLQTPPSRTWIFATARDIRMVFLLIRGTSGSYVLSVSVLTIIGKMQKFPVMDFPCKHIKIIVFHEFFFFFFT